MKKTVIGSLVALIGVLLIKIICTLIEGSLTVMSSIVIQLGGIGAVVIIGAVIANFYEKVDIKRCLVNALVLSVISVGSASIYSDFIAPPNIEKLIEQSENANMSYVQNGEDGNSADDQETKVIQSVELEDGAELTQEELQKMIENGEVELVPEGEQTVGDPSQAQGEVSQDIWTVPVQEAQGASIITDLLAFAAIAFFAGLVGNRYRTNKSVKAAPAEQSL